MRSTPVPGIPLLLLGLLYLCGGCSPALQVRFDERTDFSRFGTWSWLPDAARMIDAPTPYAIGLDRELAQLVERALAARGFTRVRRGGDLRIGALLNVRREHETVYETGAVEQLSTYSSDGTYLIQRSVAHRETYERSRLVIYAVHPESLEIVWQGALERRYKGAFGPHVRSVVERLLANFPTAGAGPPPKRREPAATGYTVAAPGDAPDA